MKEIRNVRQKQFFFELFEMFQTIRRKNVRIDHDLNIRFL